KSPERRIAEGFLAKLRGDELFSRTWSPIVLVESPTIEAMNAFAAGTCSVGVGGAKPVDRPSKRQTSLVSFLVSLYMAKEETSIDSECPGLDWMSYVRSLAWGLVLDDVNSGAHMAFATTTVVPLTPLLTLEGVMIQSYRVTFET